MKRKERILGMIFLAFSFFVLGGLLTFGTVVYSWFHYGSSHICPHSIIHNYTIQNADLIYLKKEASCTSKSVYYYSCLCGARGNSTFEIGNVNLEKHHFVSTEDLLTDICTNCGEIFQKSFVDLSKCENIISYSGLKEVEEDFVKEVINAIHNPNEYEEVIYKDEPHLNFTYSKKISSEAYYRIYGFFTFYFGDFNVWGSEYLKSNDFEWPHMFDIEMKEECIEVYIPVSSIPILREKRASYIKEAEIALANIYEGTETEMLLQICEYIKDYSILPGAACDSCTDFWNTQKATCLAYSMAFRQLAERLGIQCDIIVGYTVGDGYHAWNRVKLSDDTYKYYDLTWYITGNDAQYINANSLSHDGFWINSYCP